MKRISSLLIGASFIVMSSAGMAAAVTSLDANWICTTNASSSSLEADKANDKLMSETAKSATDAFSFASQNCRDCTKITCEIK